MIHFSNHHFPPFSITEPPRCLTFAADTFLQTTTSILFHYQTTTLFDFAADTFLQTTTSILFHHQTTTLFAFASFLFPTTKPPRCLHLLLIHFPNHHFPPLHHQTTMLFAFAAHTFSQPPPSPLSTTKPPRCLPLPLIRFAIESNFSLGRFLVDINGSRISCADRRSGPLRIESRQWKF